VNFLHKDITKLRCSEKNSVLQYVATTRPLWVACCMIYMVCQNIAAVFWWHHSHWCIVSMSW